MKKLLVITFFISCIAYSQNKDEAEKKVNEGVLIHDQGKYNEALEVYNYALKLDKNNLLALSEKAMTLNAAKQYNEAINVSKLAIEIHPNEDIKNVYVSYANSLDHLNQTQNSLKIYDEGLAKYPNYYQLHYNKGITLVNAKELGKAILSFQIATKANPNHSSSFNALGVLDQENRIAAILSCSRYLILDNKSSRAKTNYETIMKLMSKGVSQKDDKSISLVINSESVDGVESGKNAENNFFSTDLILSMASALDYDDKNKDKTQCQKFIDKFEMICESLEELKSKNKGYYWEFLTPYFIEMKNKKLIEPLAYIIFLPSQSADVIKFHQDHSKEILDFNNWNKSYEWNK